MQWKVETTVTFGRENHGFAPGDLLQVTKYDDRPWYKKLWSWLRRDKRHAPQLVTVSAVKDRYTLHAVELHRRFSSTGLASKAVLSQSLKNSLFPSQGV